MRRKSDIFQICITLIIGGSLIFIGFKNVHHITSSAICAIIGTVLITVGILIEWTAKQASESQVQNTQPIHTITIPKPNIKLYTGEQPMLLVLSFREKKNIVHRLKWWMFCKVFPFEYEWIESGNNNDK